MKHQGLANELREYLAEMSIRPTPDQITLLVRHVELVLAANERVNLTRVTDPLSAIRLHTADSLAILEDLTAAPSGLLLDMGSGAGFPGIPLAICSDRRVLLLDSVGKKVRELQLMITELAIQQRVTARWTRAEALAREMPGHFAVVAARAVSELPALVELASPLLSTGGSLVCMKGSPSGDDTERAVRVADLVGMRLDYERTLDLPDDAGHRTVLCYRKDSAAKVALPRREGLAQHAPLA